MALLTQLRPCQLSSCSSCKSLAYPWSRSCQNISPRSQRVSCDLLWSLQQCMCAATSTETKMVEFQQLNRCDFWCYGFLIKHDPNKNSPGVPAYQCPTQANRKTPQPSPWLYNMTERDEFEAKLQHSWKRLMYTTRCWSLLKSMNWTLFSGSCSKR